MGVVGHFSSREIHFFFLDRIKDRKIIGMLSRLATGLGQSAQVWGRPIPIKYHARFLSSTKSNSGKVEDWNAPERDLVNFPDFHPPERTPPVRHFWIPESYFQAFHSRTGVTGPYVLPFAFITFLLSKECWVVEHNVIHGPMIIVMLIAHVRACKWAGLDQWWESSYNSYRTMFTSIRQDEIDHAKAEIEVENDKQVVASSYEELIKAKKEAVGLQLESSYRQRLAEAHQQVKKRMDYQLEVGNVVRRAEQKHMVDWIISNVQKSITAKQEDEALKKCINDLKTMA